MEGPRGHRGTYREPAIVNLAAGDDSVVLPSSSATDRTKWSMGMACPGFGCGREFVQRLPVRIRFNPDQDPQHLLRPGMSVEPQVKVR